MNPNMMNRQSGGFTLVEILVAMSVLLLGMAGILGLFTAGLALERRSSLAIDTAVAMRDVEPLVRSATIKALAEGNDDGDLSIPRTPIPGWVGLDYVAEVLPLPDSETNEGYVMKITVIPRGAQEKDGFTYGYLPLRLGKSYESLVREAARETLQEAK